MGTVEHYARCEQSRTKRNTGIDGARPDPTASRQSRRDNHRGGALTAPATCLARRQQGSATTSKNELFNPVSVASCAASTGPAGLKRTAAGRRWLPGLNETANFVLPIPLKTTPEPSVRMRKRDRDRVERIRLAGGPKPTLRERAVSLVLEKGEARTKDLTDIGIPRCYLARMCDEGLLVKVGYGRYCAATRQAS